MQRSPFFFLSQLGDKPGMPATPTTSLHPLPADVNLISVSLLSLPFRAAHAVGDVAQNTLLGLGHWSWRGTRGVSALRPIGSGLSALLVSAAIGLVLKAARLPPRRLR